MTQPLRIVSDPIEQVYTKANGTTGYRYGRGRRLPVRVGIFHYSATFTAAATKHILERRGLSAHGSLERDGTYHQHVSDGDRAVHAGYGSWLGMSGLNHRSLGVEVVNLGWMDGLWDHHAQQTAQSVGAFIFEWKRANDLEREVPTDGPRYYRSEYDKNRQRATHILTRAPSARFDDHREGTRGKLWVRYTEAQKQACCALAVRWMQGHAILPECIVGHEHVSPTRKLDPGPAFGEVWRAIEVAVNDYCARLWPEGINYRFRLEERIKALQSHLARLGLYHLSIDGDWGKGTQSALEEALLLFHDDYSFRRWEPRVQNITTICNDLRLVPGYNPELMTDAEASRLRTNTSRVIDLIG